MAIPTLCPDTSGNTLYAAAENRFAHRIIVRSTAMYRDQDIGHSATSVSIFVFSSALCVVASAISQFAFALPTNGQVVAGGASVQQITA